MKKKILLFFSVLFAAVILLPIATSAHKGKTDAYGGHYDRSTGEYHYHHGFEAHQHYDINGDGVPDCPYDFEDRTNHTSGTSSGSSRSSGITSETKPPEFFTVVKEVEVPVYRVPDWVYWSLPILLFFILLLALLLHSRNKDLSELRSRADEEIELERKKIATLQKSLDSLSGEAGQLRKQIAVEKSKIVENYRIILNREIKDRMKNDIGESYLCSLANAPPNSSVDEFGMPHCIVHGNDIFLFYVSSTGKYHTIYCHHAKGCKEINALQIKNSKSKLSPCFVCSPKLPDTDWVFRYVQYREMLETMQSEEDSKKS